MTQVRRVARIAGPLAGTAVAVAALAVAWTSSSSPSAAGSTSASGHVGDLTVTGAHVPQPASPDVAAAYFVVENKGGADDRLVSASSPDAASVSAHDTTTSGAIETMTSLGPVVVPAHGTVQFEVGQKHLMIEEPKHALRQGQTVSLSLVFAKAGALTLQVPVTALGTDS